MPGTSDTFTTSNRLDKQPTGGNYDQWGAYLNTNFDLIDDAKDGNAIIVMASQQYTLSVNNAATDEARMASITITGTPGGTGTVTAPNVEKLTVVENLVNGGYPIVWTNGTGASQVVYNGAVVDMQCDLAGNMKVVGGSQLGTRILHQLLPGTATDDAVRVDQVGTLAMGIPSGGTAAQTIIKNSSTAGDASWATKYFVPTAGTASQFLVKNTTTNGDFAWTTVNVLTQGLQTIYVPAQSFEPLTTNGGTQTTMQCTTSSKMVKALVLGSATTQYASFDVQMPKSWDGKNIAVAFNAFTTGATGTGVYEMNVGLAQSFSGAALDAGFNYSTAALGTEQSTASYVTVTGTITASISGGTASQGSILSLMVRRNTTSTNQSLSGNVFLTGVVVRYTNNLPNDN